MWDCPGVLTQLLREHHSLQNLGWEWGLCSWRDSASASSLAAGTPEQGPARSQQGLPPGAAKGEAPPSPTVWAVS